jgi:hypothetical protein
MVRDSFASRRGKIERAYGRGGIAAFVEPKLTAVWVKSRERRIGLGEFVLIILTGIPILMDQKLPANSS